jgi:hypothetical protein
MSHRPRHHVAPDFRLCELLENGQWVPVVKKKSPEADRKLDGGS